MKKFISLLILVFQFHLCFTQSWMIYGPAGIAANNICFGPYFYEDEMICAASGFYLFSNTTFEWEYYTVDSLPVYEGVFLNFETLIFVTGNGSDSDGIYKFDKQSGQSEELYSCLKPYFIRYDGYGEKYYVGYENGLLVSEDGNSWADEPFFNDKPCVEMANQFNTIVIKANILAPSLFWSDNDGDTWNTSQTYLQISRLAFYGSELFGVLPDNSYSSGFYKSTDLANTWQVEFWSMYMSDVCYDDLDGILYVGWNNPGSEYQGIAMYEPGSGTAGLTFFNDGLPNTNINRIKFKPIFDAYYAFVCTDSGVYSYLFVGVKENNSVNNLSLQVSPNPFSDEIKFEFNLSGAQPYSLEIFNISGERIKCINAAYGSSGKQSLTWNPNKEEISLSDGIFFVKLTQGEKSTIRKVIYSGK